MDNSVELKRTREKDQDDNLEEIKKMKMREQEALAMEKKSLPKIKIQSLSLRGDFVTIINMDTIDVDISNWRLISLVGVDQIFVFPQGTILKAGATTTVWSGRESDKKHNPPLSFFWTKRNIWNDDGDAALLQTAELIDVDRVQEKPPEFTYKVEIQELNLVGDYVTIINKGNNDQIMSGWFLKSVIGNQFFVFPKGTVLKSGGTITVWSGKESDKRHNPPSSLAWTKRYMWSDKGDYAVLYDSNGDFVSDKQDFPIRADKHVTPPAKSLVESGVKKEEDENNESTMDLSQ